MLSSLRSIPLQEIANHRDSVVCLHTHLIPVNESNTVEIVDGSNGWVLCSIWSGTTVVVWHDGSVGIYCPHDAAELLQVFSKRKSTEELKVIEEIEQATAGLPFELMSSGLVETLPGRDQIRVAMWYYHPLAQVGED